jgi:hypothetical protein
MVSARRKEPLLSGDLSEDKGLSGAEQELALIVYY